MANMIPLSTAQLFESNSDSSYTTPNIIGMPKRAEEFEKVFASPLSQQAQMGPWANKFAQSSSMMGRQPLNVPASVGAPQMAAANVMSDYAHGLEDTLIIDEPLWNSNRTLMGQPQVPVKPEDLCPTRISSHGLMGAQDYMGM